MAFSLVDPLCKPLVSKDLLLSKDLPGETRLNVYLSLATDNAIKRFTIIDKEFLVVNENSFSFFNVRHETTVEIGSEVGSHNPIRSLLRVFNSIFMLRVFFPYWGYSEDI